MIHAVLQFRFNSFLIFGLACMGHNSLMFPVVHYYSFMMKFGIYHLAENIQTCAAVLAKCRSKVTLSSLSVWRKFTQNRRWTDGRKKEEVALRITMTFGNCRTDVQAAFPRRSSGDGRPNTLRDISSAFFLFKITSNKSQILRQTVGRASLFIPICNLQP